MITDKEPALFLFRTIVEWDDTYKVFVARCLETGGAATADDPDTVAEMMKELLLEEATYAVKNNNLANLLSSPSALPVWLRYLDLARQAAPERTRLTVATQPTEKHFIEVATVRADQNGEEYEPPFIEADFLDALRKVSRKLPEKPK